VIPRTLEYSETDNTEYVLGRSVVEYVHLGSLSAITSEVVKMVDDPTGSVGARQSGLE